MINLEKYYKEHVSKEDYYYKFYNELITRAEEDKKVINIVNISDIKLYNNKVQVHQKNTEVYIQTIKNNFTIKFDNAIEAVKFVTKVTDVVTGTTMSDRGVKKVKNAFDKVDDVLVSFFVNNRMSLSTAVYILRE